MPINSGTFSGINFCFNSINSTPLTSCTNPCCAAIGDGINEALTSFGWDSNSCVLLGVLDSHCVAGARGSDGVQNALADSQALLEDC